MNRILKRLELITGDSITYGDALQTVGSEILGNKFAGIYIDGEDIPRPKSNTGILINRPKNQHWIAQYTDSKGKTHTYDSYGRTMGINPVKPPEYFLQKGKQTNCGARSLSYLYYKLVVATGNPTKSDLK